MHNRKRKAKKSEDEPDSKKSKTETGDDGLDAATKEKLKKQMKKIYYYRDMLQRHLQKKDLEALLVLNGQEIPSGADRVR